MMKLTLVFILWVAFVSADNDEDSTDEDLARSKMENLDLFQGDIVETDVDNKDERVSRYIAANTKLWTNNRIPYIIHSVPFTNLNKSKAVIEEAMEEYHKNTCVRFVPRSDEKSYLKIFSGGGCYSTCTGMKGGSEQQLSLAAGCRHKGIIMHELGHIVGLFHEQNRYDRNNYLTINWDNIKEGGRKAFDIIPENPKYPSTEFDYDSIMMYDNYAFSKSKTLKTMEAKNGQKLVHSVYKKHLSAGDVKKINLIYNCPEKKE